jgi:pyrroloquinoline quinone biosynthesis protein B
MDLLESRVRSGELQVYFTHLNHSNPALDPDGPEAREIARRGFHILADSQEIALQHGPE